MTDDFDTAARAWAAEKRRATYDPNDHISPERRAEIYREGMAKVRAFLTARGYPLHARGHRPTTTEEPS